MKRLSFVVGGVEGRRRGERSPSIQRGNDGVRELAAMMMMMLNIILIMIILEKQGTDFISAPVSSLPFSSRAHRLR